MSNFLRRNGVMAAAVVVLAALFFGSLLGVRPDTGMVQAAVITPVTQTGRGDLSREARFFDVEVITADTRKCFDLADYEIIDIQYQVDATAVNTTSVSLQQTNIDPTNGPFNTANAIATVVSTDANVMVQLPTFGKWNCVLADVTNSNPLTLTIIGVAK